MQKWIAHFLNKIENQARKRSFLAHERGMTLIEIVIVLTIASLVMVGAIVGGTALMQRSRISETRKAVFQISRDIETWQNEHPSSNPCSFGSLDELFKQKALSSLPKDKWQNPYQVRCPGEHSQSVDIWSLGPDKKDGTPDDIRSWDNE